MMKQIYSFLLFVMIAAFGFGQTTIYDADFSTDDDGFADHSSSNPPAAAPATASGGVAPNNWTLSYNNTPATDNGGNFFKVVNGELVSRDWGGQGIFTSANIDVSALNEVTISATTTEANANDDSFNYFYILDGGTRVDAPNNMLTYSVVSLDVSSANTLNVGFEFSENGGNQGYNTSSFTVTTPSTDPQIAMTLDTPTTVFGYELNDGANSVEDFVNVTGTNLNAMETVTFNAPTNYEISTDGTVYSNSLTLDSDALGEIDDLFLIRMVSGLSTGSYNGDVTAYGAGVAMAMPESLSVTGEVTETIHLVINEFLADPPSGSDADGNGTSDSQGDEFIEFYNTGTSSIDLSGYTIEDEVQVRHTFPAGSSIEGQEFLVIFGSQVSGGNFLGLNNSGDTITVRDSDDNVVIQISYGSEGGNDESLARNPDFTGDFEGQSSIVPGRDFSPGLLNDTILSVSEDQKELHAKLYINNSQQLVVVGVETASVEIYNVNGQLMAKGSNKTNVSKLSNGAYIAVIKDVNGNQITKKFIK